MSDRWYSRPVLFVTDVTRSLDFYEKQLGFRQSWRYQEHGETWIAQVERKDCELILASPLSFSEQPELRTNDRTGKGLIFISLDRDELNTTRSELEANGTQVRDGKWGYRLMVIADPDGNELFFPYPADPSEAEGELIRASSSATT